MPWWVFAFVSATAAALTAVLAKIGVKNVPSNLATAVRTLVVLVFAWAMIKGRRGRLGTTNDSSVSC